MGKGAAYQQENKTPPWGTAPGNSKTLRQREGLWRNKVRPSSCAQDLTYHHHHRATRTPTCLLAGELSHARSPPPPPPSPPYSGKRWGCAGARQGGALRRWWAQRRWKVSQPCTWWYRVFSIRS